MRRRHDRLNTESAQDREVRLERGRQARLQRMSANQRERLATESAEEPTETEIKAMP